MNKEYLSIIDEFINNEEFQKLKNETYHHTTNKYNHSLAVAKHTYNICKALKLDYISATRAAILHDFFFDKEFDNKNKTNCLLNHYKASIKNANKLTKLSKKEENIISSHMFPIGGSLPRSIESVLVDIIDDAVAIRERAFYNPKRLGQAIATLTIFLINFL